MSKLMRELFSSWSKFMEIKPIKTDADYHASLKFIEDLMTAEP